MLTKGDRVMVKDGVELYGGRYGYATEQHDLLEKGFKVMLDGDRRAIPFAASELLPVEVVVLEGALTYDDEGRYPYYSIDGVPLNETLWDKYGRGGETIRITIEHVKKEG